MRDYERKAIADAAYDAWRDGRNYDEAWDQAERIIERCEPLDRYDAEDALRCMPEPKRKPDFDDPEVAP